MTRGGGKILVVDDERLIRWSLEQQLQREGYEVLSAGTGEEALRIARADSPEVILLDVRLPDADGVDLLAKLRAADPELAVILITAFGAVEPAVRAMKLGAADYLVKPVDPEELSVTLRRTLETRSLRRDVARFQADVRQGGSLDDLIGD